MGISRLSFRHPARVPVRRRRLALGLAAVLGLGGLVETSVANTLTVTTCNDQYDPLNPRATWLRQQVAAASSGDTIDLTSLTCSTITLTHGAIPVSVANLEIDGPTGHTLTIDGNLQDRVFYQTASGGQLLLENLYITRGHTSGDGGCIFSDGTVHLFANVTVTGCYAVGGGGIAAPYVQTNSSVIDYNSGGGIFSSGARTNAPDVYLENTTVSGNTGGPGVFGSELGSITIKSSRIEGNTSPTCGGISAGDFYAHVKPSSIVNVSYSSVTANTGGYSGGICAGAVYLSHATISNNQGKLFGGGLGVFGTNRPFAGFYRGVNFADYDLVSVGSTIAGNTANIGGGIYSPYGASAIISSTISGNVATATGQSALFASGGIRTYAGLFMNSTVSGNQSQTMGGIAATTAKLFNSTVAFNASGTVGDQYPGGILIGGLRCSASCSPSLTLYSSIVANNVSGIAKNESDISLLGNATLSTSNSLVMYSNKPTSSISADPQLLPLANNGGPVQTHALGPASPALGSGSNLPSLPYDERGYPFRRSWVNGQTDIGAFQTQDRIFYNGFE